MLFLNRGPHLSAGNTMCLWGLVAAAEYLGEKLAGESSRPGLVSRAALLFERGCSGVVSARF